MQLKAENKTKSPKMKTPKKINITKESKTPENKNTPKGKKNTPAPTKAKTPAKKNQQTPQKNSPKKGKSQATPKQTHVAAPQNSNKKSKSPGQEAKKAMQAQTSNSYLDNLTEVRVYFPKGVKSYKQALASILKDAEEIRNPKVFSLLYKSPEAAQSKVESLSKINVNGKKLNIQLVDKQEHPSKRVAYLNPNGSDSEFVKKHYGADSIEQKSSWGRPNPTHILTFKSADAAEKACKKSLTLHEKQITLRPFFITEGKKPSLNSTEAKNPSVKRSSEEIAKPKNAKKAKTEKTTLKMEVDDDDDDDDEDEDEEESDEDEDDDDDEDDEDDDDDDDEE